MLGKRRHSQKLSMLSGAPGSGSRSSGEKKKKRRKWREGATQLSALRFFAPRKAPEDCGIRKSKEAIQQQQNIIQKIESNKHCVDSKKKEIRRHKSEQMFLDFGQENFGARTCPRCGMLFSRGKKEDEMIHASFCKKTSKPISFRSQKTQFIVSTIDEISNTSVWMMHGPLKEARVACPFLADKFVEAKKIMDASMGFGEDGLPKHWTAFFYVSKRVLAGVVVTERIVQAHHIAKESCAEDAFAADGHIESPSSSLRTVATPSPATLGIVQIWVDDRCRRNGVASALVDTARRHAIYGYLVPKKRCAMTQPTAAGRAFGERYFGTPLLVY
eukprot:g1729.t1